jgi:hypothetical protein
MFNTGLQEILSKTARLGLREAGEFAALKVNLFQSIWFRPLHGAFFLLETGECRIGEMNFAGVTIAEGNIGLSVRLKATAVAIVGG